MEREEMHRIRDHLFHMTDGRWHDDCTWCLTRRVHGGNGVDPAIMEEFRAEENRFLDEVAARARAVSA